MEYSTENLEQIIKIINHSTNELVKTIRDFPVDEFNKKVNEETWSAGEAVEHLIVLENLINKVLIGKTKKTDRDPTERIETIKTYFLDFGKKFSAPDLIKPTDKLKVKEDCIININDCRNNLINILSSNDITLICLDFIHRHFGGLTRVEWAYFIIYHSERHIKQIKNIEKKTGVSK
jgi:hypothetical protein